MRQMTVSLRGEVQGLDRHRTMKNGHTYDTPKNIENKVEIRRLAERKAMDEGVILPIPPGNMGYLVTIVAYMVPSKSTSKKKRNEMIECRIRPSRKPDADNIAKLWLDALVRGGIIEDDRYVTTLVVKKYYAEVEETVCTICWDEEET